MSSKEVRVDVSVATIRLLIVDDETLFAELLAAELSRTPGFEVIGVAHNEHDAARLLGQRAVDIAVVSVGLRDGAAFRLFDRLHEKPQRPHVVYLDGDLHVVHLRETLRCGALGYYTRRDSLAELTQSLRHVAAGERTFCQRARAWIVDTPDGPSLAPAYRHSALESLTRRELDVFLCVVQGATVRACAEQLKIAEKTVENYKTRLLRKLQARRTVDLVRLAIRERLIPG